MIVPFTVSVPKKRAIPPPYAFAVLPLTVPFTVVALLVLVMLLYAAVNVPTGDAADRLLALFVIAFGLFILAYRRFYKHLFALVEARIARLRGKIAERVRKTALPAFEALGSETVYAALTLDIQAIADVSPLFASIMYVAAQRGEHPVIGILRQSSHA